MTTGNASSYCGISVVWCVCVFEVTKEEALHLMWLTEIYLEAFINLYTTSVTPKVHYLVHLSEQILV